MKPRGIVFRELWADLKGTPPPCDPNAAASDRKRMVGQNAAILAALKAGDRLSGGPRGPVALRRGRAPLGVLDGVSMTTIILNLRPASPQEYA